MKVQSTAWAEAKPITSQGAAFGSLAYAAGDAASRRIDILWRAREAAGKNDPVDMALCVARFRRKWNQLGVKKPVKTAQYGCRIGVRVLSRAHDIHPYFQHPQLRHCCAYRPWQIDAGRPSDPDHRGPGGARDEGTGARFHGYRP